MREKFQEEARRLVDVLELDPRLAKKVIEVLTAALENAYLQGLTAGLEEALARINRGAREEKK